MNTHGPKTQRSVYLSILNNVWSGRPQTALEHLSQAIADNPEHPDRLKLYRLWVEIVASLNEKPALYALANHFHLLSLIEPELNKTFVALRGLIYLDIDDIHGAHLCYRSIQAEDENEYCLELRYLMAQRLSHKSVYSNLVARANKLTDYFHIKLVAAIALRHQQSDLISSLLKRSQKMFGESCPLQDEVRMHEAFERRQTAKAETFAHRLFNRFSANPDYGFYYAQSLVVNQKYSEARKIIAKVQSVVLKEDIDLQTLLLECDYQEQKNKNHQGAEMKNNHVATNKPSGSASVPRAWMIKMGAAEFFTIREQSIEHLKTLQRNLDELARPGDIVMMVGDDYRSKGQTREQWRLAAVYKVNSAPKWNPVDGHVVGMDLLSRPQNSIPFDVELKNVAQIEKHAIALDIDAVSHMTQAIEEYVDFDHRVTSILDELERTRVSA